MSTNNRADLIAKYRAKMEKWAAKAKEGEEYIYVHQGLTDTDERGPVRQAAWDMMVSGKVRLFQRRMRRPETEREVGTFDYVMRRTDA